MSARMTGGKQKTHKTKKRSAASKVPLKERTKTDLLKVAKKRGVRTTSKVTGAPLSKGGLLRKLQR